MGQRFCMWNILWEQAIIAGWEGRKVIDSAWLENLKKEMLALVEKNLTIEKKTMKTEDARKLFAKCGMQDKERLMHYRSSSNCNVYELDGCLDYFYGYMAPNTGMLSYFALYPYEEGFILQFPDKVTNRGCAFCSRQTNSFMSCRHPSSGAQIWGFLPLAL